MKAKLLIRLILVSFALISLAGKLQANEEISQEQLAFFENKIRPVLIEHCYECHSPESKTLQGNLYLHTRENLIAGGDSGPAVVPGDVEEGTLLDSMRYETFEMPPKGKLPDQVIQDFETWIKMGAPDPRQGSTPLAKAGIDLEQGREYWAFTPPRKSPLPIVEHSDFIEQPVDAFIQSKLEAAGLSLAPRASREVLIRRLYYDLIGLPPTPEQIQQFTETNSPEAYLHVVDQLLASPEFGARWGRHWLDVARYADSTGGGRSRLYSNSWRYRDYVINSFNNDKPFNQFVREQIAGDLLPADSLEQQRDQLIGCGFLMLGPHNYELQDKDLLRMEVVDEQITTLGKAFLGMTIGCARCHDHKFDPIPTADYYALAGIFRSTKSLGTGNVTSWITRSMPVEAELQAQLDQYQQQSNSLNKELAEIENEIKRLDSKSTLKQIPVNKLAGIVIDSDEPTNQFTLKGEWTVSTSVPGYVANNYLHESNSNKGNSTAIFKCALPNPGTYEVRIAYTASSNRSNSVPVKVLNGDQFLGEVRVNQQKRPKLDGSFFSLGSYEFAASEDGLINAVVEISNEATQGVVIADAVQFLSKDLLKETPSLAHTSLLRKNPLTTEVVSEIKSLKDEKQLLSQQMKELKKNAPPAPPEVIAVEEQSAEEQGDMQLCIRGNIRNLGEVIPRGVLQVAAPPGKHVIKTSQSGRLELADWLASEQNPLTARVMVNRVWAHLFGKGIVSTVDNFGTTGSPPSHPELLDHLSVEFMEDGWSIKRLIRRIVLSRTYQSSSGLVPQAEKIDPQNQLLSSFPKRRADAEYLRDALLFISGKLNEQHGGETVKSGTNSEFGYAYTSQRRSVYLPVFRNRLEELMTVFNFPDPNLVQGQRVNTTLPTQALFMMNHPRMLEYAKGTADIILDQTELNDQQKLDWLYLSSVGRKPTQQEQQICLDYLGESTEIDEKTRWSTLCQALFCSIDFRFIE